MRTFLDISYAVGCIGILYWLLFGFASKNNKKSNGE